MDHPMTTVHWKLTVLLGLLLVAVPRGNFVHAQDYKVGVARVDITPEDRKSVV